jgi:glucokinase
VAADEHQAIDRAQVELGSPWVLGLDVGGTKMAAGAVDENGTVAFLRRVPTPRAGAEEVFSVLIEAAGAVIEEASRVVGGPVACGVGCGGPMTKGGELVSPVNIPGWRDFPLASRLRSALGLPVVVDNDAKALAVGQWRWGAAAGVENFLAMVVSTGIGGGIVLDGRLLDGAEGNAGHIGHMIVEPGGRVCGCGARGCLEAEASGTAIAAISGSPPWEAPEELRMRSARLVGRAVASVINLLDLELVLIGGSVALGYGAPYLEWVRQEVESLTRIAFARKARVGFVSGADAAGVLGAGALGWSLVESETAGGGQR